MNPSPCKQLGWASGERSTSARMDSMGRSEHPKTPEEALGIFIETMVYSRGSLSVSGPESAVPPEHLSHTYKRREWERSVDKHGHEVMQRPFHLHPLHDARAGWQESGELPGGMDEGEVKEKPQWASTKAPVPWSRCRASDNSPFLPTQELGVSKSSYRAADLRTNKRQCFFHPTHD